MHPDDTRLRETKLDPARGRLAPTKISHVVRRTARYAELLAWYQSVLGLRVVQGDEQITFLSYDDEHHRLAIANLPGLPEQPPLCAGVDHVAFGMADLGDLLHTYARLRDEGIAPYWCINHGPTTSLYYKDPDGSRVELQAENFESLEACMRWMQSEEFASNPLGVIFDPEELLARYRAGEPLEKLSLRPPLPEGATPAEMFRF